MSAVKIGIFAISLQTSSEHINLVCKEQSLSKNEKSILFLHAGINIPHKEHFNNLGSKYDTTSSRNT